ncbi:ABC transporter permease [Lichenicola sp.]|uniref:ABC transporter permease n=1 Tax=Lichenicola sp. TaxID=2804529 RepID=UPI003B008EC9
MPDRVSRLLRRHGATLFCALALGLILAVYFIEQPLALSGFGLTSLGNASLALVLVAIGQTCVLLAGGLDLSIGAIVSLVNCFAATVMGDSVSSILLATAGSLLLGSLAGAINGMLVAYGRLEPLIATFSTLFIYGGLALMIRPQPGGHIADSFANLLTGNIGIVPNSVLLLLVLLVLVWLPVFRSRLGRFIFAVGDSDDSAYASGLPVRRVRIATYTLSGFFASAAGLFLAAETTSGDAGIGSLYTLNSLAAAVLGGVALSGGRGGVIGAILGGIVLSVILNLLGVIGVPAFWQDLIEGCLLVMVLTAAGLQRLRIDDWTRLLRRGGA